MLASLLLRPTARSRFPIAVLFLVVAPRQRGASALSVLNDFLLQDTSPPAQKSFGSPGMFMGSPPVTFLISCSYSP